MAYHNEEHAVLNRKATIASVSVASILVLLKLYVWFETDSIAILSSLMDSMLDLGASLVTFYAIRKAIVPADSDHRFGHGKAEPLAALIQAGFITGSSFLLLFESFSRFIAPKPIENEMLGIGVMVISIILTLFLVMYQKHVASATGSVAVSADSIHYAGDFFMNIGVICSIALTYYLGWQLVDPIFGLAISAYLFYSAFMVGRQSLDMLMDRELPIEESAKIREIALGVPKVLDVHALKTRRSGPHIFIQMHLDMDGSLTLLEAHSIADKVENLVMKEFPNSEVIVHQDPHDEEPHDEFKQDTLMAGNNIKQIGGKE